MFYLIGGILSVFKAPGLGVVNRACWGLIVGLRLVVGGGLVVGWGRNIGGGRGIGWRMAICWGRGVGRGRVDDSMCNRGVSYSMSHRVNYSLVVDRAGVVHKGSHRVVVYRGIGSSRGRSVAVHLAVCFSLSFGLHKAGQGES